LYVENLKGATGEVALRLGAENDAFGVVNVGDDAKLVKLCEEHGLAIGELEFSGSLFHEINAPSSTVNVLIGSKKFTEGWSSWRVSTMGLMNVGRGEGAQIIQLFGRGVRLKGFDMSLKRSGKTQLADGVERPQYITALENLGVFGIRADYMAEFRKHLQEEGLPTNDERVEFLLPVITNLGTQPLKTIRLKKTINGVSTEFGDAFRRLGPIPTVQRPDPASDRPTEYLQKNKVVLNWYPKIKAIKSAGVIGGDDAQQPHQAHFTPGHVAFLNQDRLYFELERFKAERGWYNLNLTRSGIAELLADQSWYEVLIPPEELAFDSFEKVALWGELALALLKKYAERYYTFRKREWELPHLEYQDLVDTDPNLLGVGASPGDAYYRILIDQSQEEIVAKLEELKKRIEDADLKPWEFRTLKAIWFGRHLYQPLLHMRDKIVEISPVPLNKGERAFIDDLKRFHDNDGGFFSGKEMYLLRNLSKGRGVGFFEAGNFHPDFILWLLVAGEQHVVFVDPKGIRNIGATDPKVRFHAEIKKIEERLGDADVKLHSFIISTTPSFTMRMLWRMEKAEMQSHHVLFQEEDQDSYIRWML
ncbi:MAG: DEAD/DEAH box helicase, partial [Patescibacteria group bacterium]|nr:DEAD/DEAH box helicase [Patescibacteria group bacterium]